jgi:hypothetical protein
MTFSDDSIMLAQRAFHLSTARAVVSQLVELTPFADVAAR